MSMVYVCHQQNPVLKRKCSDLVDDRAFFCGRPGGSDLPDEVTQPHRGRHLNPKIYSALTLT